MHLSNRPHTIYCLEVNDMQKIWIVGVVVVAAVVIGAAIVLTGGEPARER